MAVPSPRDAPVTSAATPLAMAFSIGSMDTAVWLRTQVRLWRRGRQADLCRLLAAVPRHASNVDAAAPGAHRILARAAYGVRPSTSAQIRARGLRVLRRRRDP
jgi:hypothetical protein